MILTFIILIITIVLFIQAKLRPDLVGVMSVIALFLVGILDTKQALAGFSDPTVIMIAALFVVGEGLVRTNVTAWLAQKFLFLAGSNKTRLLILLTLGTGLLSAVMSNTGTVATLIPVVVSAAWSVGSLPSKFLIPLAFSANAGGLLTLTGTPPNIVVSETLIAAGFEPFGYFEYSLVGLPILIAVIIYLVYVAQKLLPARKMDTEPINLSEALHELADDYLSVDNVYRLRVRRGSELAGKTLAEARLGQSYGVEVLHLKRAKKEDDDYSLPSNRIRENLGRLRAGSTDNIVTAETVIEVDDVLVVNARQATIDRIMLKFNLALKPAIESQSQLAQKLISPEVGLAEVLLTPRSAYIGRTVAEGHIFDKFGIQVLSIRRRGQAIDTRTTRLAFGDALLVRGRWDAIALLQAERRNFVVVGSPQAMERQIVSLGTRSYIAIAALLGMIVLMVSGLVPTVIAALLAGIVMVLGGCLTIDVAYRSISWSGVILIAAMIPMSIALEITGGAEFLTNGLVNSLGSLHPLILMSGIFLLTSVLSQVINNTATTVLVAPIVLRTALELGISPYPLLMFVAVGASTAFLTPIGTTTNLMVMAPGNYQFKDYFKVGLPLVFLFWIIGLILIPLIWSL